MSELCFSYWRMRGFPYYDLSKEEMVEEFLRLTETPRERMFLGNVIQMSIIGLKLANYFHPQMWEVPVKGSKAPFEQFNDDVKLRLIIRKALAIWPNRLSVNESNMRRILKTYSNTAGVSNFRPTAAKAIYECFSGEGEPILDFSAGYGGRLLGCLPLRRSYTGIDPCYKQIVGLKRMLRTLESLVSLNSTAKILFACAEDAMPKMKSSSFSLIFSSPPYFDLERYSKDSRQSYVRYPVYDQWLDRFLTSVISESHRLLEPGGYLILNVANTNGYKLAKDVLRIARLGFTLTKTYHLRLGHKPYLRLTKENAYKLEPVFVFRRLRSYSSKGRIGYAPVKMTSLR